MSVIALLRGINVGGNKMIGMADLKTMLLALGYRRPRTLLQSGNVVFEAGARAPAKIEAELEAGVRKRFGIDVDVIVRTAAEWQKVIVSNPFPDEAARDPSRLVVLSMKEPIAAARVNMLQAAISGRETMRGGGRHAYIVYPDGMGRSKLTLTAIEKALGVRGTARNWNTVLKLKDLACE